MTLFGIVQWDLLQCPYSSSSIALVATTSVEQPPSARGPASVCRDDKGPPSTRGPASVCRDDKGPPSARGPASVCRDDKGPPSTRGPASVCRDDKGLFVVIVVVRVSVLHSL